MSIINGKIRKVTNPIWTIKRCSVERFGVLDSSKLGKRPSSLDGELHVEETTEDDGDSDTSFSEKRWGATVVTGGGTLSSSCGGGDMTRAERQDGARKTRSKLTEIHNLPPTLYTGCGVWRSGR